MSTLAATDFVISSDARVLRDVQRPNCRLAIWQRTLEFDPQPLVTGYTEKLCLTVPAENPAPALLEALRSAGFAAGDSLQLLADDICQLCALFRPVANTAAIEIRLEIVTTDACRKFHGDYVTARLITTYAGAGTQWLDSEDAARVADGLEPQSIRQMQPGDVGIFKGRLATDTPAIHRSPPISGTGEKRMVLVLNPVTG